MRGDHSTLNDHGACARVIRPTALMSTPELRIQSGMAIHTRPSGMPEENDSSATEAVRHDVIAAARADSEEGFLRVGALTSATRRDDKGYIRPRPLPLSYPAGEASSAATSDRST